MTNIITLETIQARQDELVAMIAAFNAAKTTINVPAATIELRPGEHYAGLVLNDDGTPSHHLVLVTRPDKLMCWQDAKDWASKVGGELPTRREMSLIYAHCHAHVKHEWHWSSEVSDVITSRAWSCHLSNSLQSIHLKSCENDVVVIRRIPIGGQDE